MSIIELAIWQLEQIDAEQELIGQKLRIRELIAK
jgi:hypothetical protein